MSYAWNRWVQLRSDANQALAKLTVANKNWDQWHAVESERQRARADLVRLETAAAEAWRFAMAVERGEEEDV